MLKAIYERLKGVFGYSDTSEEARPPSPQVPILSKPLCLIVNPSRGDLETILAALARANIRFEVLTGADALRGAMAQNAPAIVICGFDDVAQIGESVRILGGLGFQGVVQPIANSAAAAAVFKAHPPPAASVRVLQPIDVPIQRHDLQDVLDLEGLSRTDTGAASVSLRLALKNDWVSFWYQPKVNFASKMLVGIETLARVIHPQHGTLLPASFLGGATAEDLKLLGRASIRAALEDWKIFDKLRFNLLFSVNTPITTLYTPGIVDLIRSSRPADARWPGLLLEIEAREMIDNQRRLATFASEASSENIRLCVDNYGLKGTAEADFSGFQIAEIKLHQRLVQGASLTSERGAECAAAARAARRYSPIIVAAGIETAADLAFVRRIGCDVGQGKHLSEPLDLRRFIDLLHRRTSGRGSDAKHESQPSCSNAH